MPNIIPPEEEERSSQSGIEAGQAVNEINNTPSAEETKPPTRAPMRYNFPGAYKLPENMRLFTAGEVRRGEAESQGFRIVDYDWGDAMARQYMRPNQAYFAEDPKRLAKFYNFLQSAPPEWRAPDWMEPGKIIEAYNYMSQRTGESWENWEPLDINDPGSIYLTTLQGPPSNFSLPSETNKINELIQKIYGTQQETSPYIVNGSEGGWSNLEDWQQFMLGLINPQPMTDRPEWTRVTAAAGLGVGGALGGVALGGIIAGGIGAATGTALSPGVGTAIGALLGLIIGGATGYQAYTGQEIPVLNELLTILDIGAATTEKLIGTLWQLIDLDDDESVKEILSNLPAAWKASTVAYESDPVGTWLTNAVSLSANKINPDWSSGMTAKYSDGEVWYIEKGITEPMLARGGVLGGSLLDEVRARIAAQDEDIELIYADIVDRTGFSGSLGDFIQQSIIDPLQVAPYVINNIGGNLATHFGDARLADAFAKTRGHLDTDILPVGFQQLYSVVTGREGTGGIFNTLGVYRSSIQGGITVGDTAPVAAADLTPFEKWIGKLTPEGEFSELQPSAASADTPKWKNWLTYLTELTPEAKAATFIDLAHTNISTIIQMASGDPEGMIKLLRQVANVDPVSVGQIGEALINSPAGATISVAVKDFITSGFPEQALSVWEATSNPRTMLNNMAKALGEENPGRLLELIDSEPDAVLIRILNAAEAKNDPISLNIAKEINDGNMTADSLKQMMAPYLGEDPAPWTAEQFATQLTVKMADHLDDFLVKRYDIKPDSWVFRMSSALKSFQSLAVLGFNPLYAVNNWVNNVSTRAAQGVFGFMTPKQIDSFWSRMGVKPANLDAGIGMAGEMAGGVGQMSRTAIKAAMDPGDWISKVQQVGKRVSKLGIFSQIAGKIEVAESRQAATIGAMQMWSKLWREGSGFQKLPANVEAKLRTISPSLPDMLYSLVRSGMNMDDITTALYGQSTYRGIEGVVDEAARRAFPDAPDIARQVLDSSGAKEELADLLNRAKTPNDVDMAYDYINTRINDVIDQTMKNDLLTRAEDVRNQVEAEGWAVVIPLWGELWDAFSQRQLNDLVENGKTAQLARNLQLDGHLLEANNIWQSRNVESKQQWLRINAFMLQTAKGIIDAIDTNNQAGKQYINLMSQWIDDWGKFFVFRDRAWINYLNGGYPDYQSVLLDISDSYNHHVETERITFLKMFETLGNVYEHTSNRPAQEVIEWGNRVMEVRDKTTDAIKNFRDGLRKNAYSESLDPITAWTKFNNETLRPLIIERRNVTVNGAYELANGKMQGPQAESTYTGTDPVKAAVAADINTKKIQQDAYNSLVERVLAADSAMTRQTLEGQIQSAFKLDEEHTAGVMALLDAYANTWADKNDSTPSKWYAEHVAAALKDGNTDVINSLMQGERGAVNFLDDGRAIIRAFHGANVSTIVHELGYIFRRDLDGIDLDAVAKWGGLEDGAEFTKLQQEFQDGTISKANRKRYVDAEEKFANGWERYLAEGKSPTAKLAAVFKKFTSWLIEIYRSLTGRGARGTIGSELLDTPLDVNIGDEIMFGNRPIKIRDIFDKMIASEGDIVRFRYEQGLPVRQDLINKYLGPEQMVQQAEKPDPFADMVTIQNRAEQVDYPTGPTDPIPDLNFAGLEPKLTFGDLNKPISEWPEWIRNAADIALYEMSAEMEVGQPGYRWAVEVEGQGSTKEWYGVSSSYPDWYKRGQYWTRQYKNETGKAAVMLVIDDMRNNIVDGVNKPLYKEIQEIMLSRAMATDDLQNALGINPYNERFAQLSEMAESGLASEKAPYQLQDIKRDLERDVYNAQFRTDWEGIDEYISNANELITRIDDRLKGRQYHDVVAMNKKDRTTGETIIFQIIQDNQIIADVPAGFKQIEVITAANQTARILGIDPENHNVIVYEVDGQLKYAERSASGTLYQGAIGEVPVGGTPTVRYDGSMLDEVNSESLRVLFDQMRDITQDDFANNRSFKFSELPDDLAAEVRKWAGGLEEQMAGTKLATIRYGEMQRNRALLDYKKRYGIDNVLGIVFPYEFWLTRSMGEWAKRMVDKPAWFAMYSRYRNLQKKMEQEGIPSRFQGKMRIPAPWLPDWMGDALYIDPLKSLFAPAQMFSPLEMLSKTSDNIYETAVRAVQAMAQEGVITATQADEVISSQSGPIWEQAMAEAQSSMSDEIGDPMTMASMMMTPAMWWTYPYYLATGQRDKLNPLPITRTGQALRGLGGENSILGFIGNILALPEETLRKKFNMNVYGEWGDYYLDRMLSNMAGDGTITADEALTAMIERTGPAFEEATRRVEQDLALKMPGSQTLMAIQEGKFGAIPMTLLTTLFPAGLLPQGELELRGLKDEYNAAWDAYNAGDINAVNTFYDKYPEYQTRTALWAEPEERLRQNLISQIWEKYTELDSMNKGLVSDQLGDIFKQTILDKTTRDYTAVDIETLAYWAQSLGGSVPRTSQTQSIADLPLYQQPSLDIYSPEVVQAVEQFQEKRSQMFPDYEYLQSVYFALPEDQRKGYLIQNPKLKEYWEWKDKYYEAVPLVARWAEEQQARYESGDSLYTTTNTVEIDPMAELAQGYASNMSQNLRAQMLLTWYTGKDVTGGARLLLIQDWEALGKPGDSFEAWVETVLMNGLGLTP